MRSILNDTNNRLHSPGKRSAGLTRRHLLLGAGAVVLGTTAAGALPLTRRWEYIVIHHSAGSFGNPAFLKKVKQRRQGKGIIRCMAYHFVIGNGSGMDMGQVACDARWRYRLWGQHVSVRNPDHNLRGIGICLVGNFEQQPIPEKQYLSLVRFVKNLMKTYDIAPENVNGHRYIQGEKTLCPGQYFPMQRFQKDICMV